MPILATITATTSRAGSAVDMDAIGASTGGTGYYLADLDGEVDPGVLAALRPRGGVQRVGVRIILHGWDENGPANGDPQLRMDPYLVGGWTVTRSLGQMAQGASFQLSATNGDTPLGSQMAVPAMLSIGSPWDIKLAYRYGANDELLAELPLLSLGRVESISRDDRGVIVDSIQLSDDLFGYRGILSTMQLPAGHGLTYAQTVRKLWQVAGGAAPVREVGLYLPPIPGDFQFRKEVNLLKGDALALIAAFGDLLGVHYFLDEDGLASGAVYAPETQRGPIQGVIDERDILNAVDGSLEGFTIRPMPAPPTHVCFTGTKQHIREVVGRHQVSLPSETYATFAPRVARYLNNVGNTYTDSGATETVQDLKRTESQTVLDVDGETVVGITSSSKAWHNLSAARYSIATNLALTALGGVYVETENDAGALAYAWNRERYIDSTFSTQSREFAADGWLKSELQEQWSIHHRRAAIQSRPNQTVAWTDTTNAPGTTTVKVLGNGEGVAETRAVLRLTERKTVQHGSLNGYRTYRRTRIATWDRAPGWQYRYGDGFISSDATETFRTTSDLEEEWLAIAGREDQHLYKWERRNAAGAIVEHGRELRQGYLEAADKRTDVAPQLADYDSAAEWSLAVAASKFDQQVMHAEVQDDPAIDVLGRARVDRQATYELAQAPWQLENAARRLFIKGRARTVSFSVPPNPLFKIGQWWRIRNRKPGIDCDHDGIILDSQFEQRGNRGAIVQRLTVAVH